MREEIIDGSKKIVMSESEFQNEVLRIVFD